MRTQVTLKAEKRNATGKGAARKLRASGRVPGVVYGTETETIELSVDANEAEHLFRSISVENTLVDLELEGEKEPIPTLIREIQAHPFKAELLHVDFYRIQAGVKLEVEIPVHLEGIPEGVKQSGGILQQVIHDLRVLVLPSKIPEFFTVDVSHLEMNEAVHVSEMDLGEDVEVLVDLDRTVASVVAPKMVIEEEEEEAEEIEVPLVDEEGEPLEGEALAEAQAEAEAEAGSEED